MGIRNSLIFVCLAIFLMAGSAQARNQIKVVGSSTVYPFSSYVAEEFGATTDYPTPVADTLEKHKILYILPFSFMLYRFRVRSFG